MIDADDLALLSVSFTAAMAQAPGAAAADVVLHELGWAELLAASPRQGAAAAFAALGTTGSAACLLDDVVANAVGLTVVPDMCVLLPAPARRDPPGTRVGSSIHVDGLASARIGFSTRVVVPVADDGAVEFFEIDAGLLQRHAAASLDPARPFRRVAADVTADDARVVTVTGTWDGAVRDARAALAHQLIAVSRVMLEQARQHAVDRVQFGRPVASFQAVRHKLAEALVAIEGAESVVTACAGDDCDPLVATLAKSLAGAAARLTGANAQQVLAGIGFTTDHPFHLSLKRMMVIDTLFGSARTLPAEIGRALLAHGGAPRLVEL